MENVSTLAPSLMNRTDDYMNATEYIATAPPKQAAMSMFPPDYFVIPAEDMDKIRLAMYGVIIPLTALIGLVGNVISFVVLLRHKMPKTTRMALVSITISDFLHLITVLLFCGIGISNALSFQPGLNAGNKAHPIFGSYLVMVFGRISSMLIVIISLERLCAVCFPLRIKTICSSKVMGSCIFACSLFCFLFFIPNILEVQSKDIPSQNSSEVITIIALTELGKNRDFYNTLYIANMMLMRIIPFAIVMVCNGVISVSLYRSRSTRSTMTGHKTEESSAEHRITQMLLSLSVLYFFCMLPGAVLVIVRLADVNTPFPFNRNNVYNLFSIIFYWTEVINSSANFIVYIMSSQEMRVQFKKVCRIQRTAKYPSQTYDLGSGSMSASVASREGQ